jgi:hypothetical protein
MSNLQRGVVLPGFSSHRIGQSACTGQSPLLTPIRPRLLPLFPFFSFPLTRCLRGCVALSCAIPPHFPKMPPAIAENASNTAGQKPESSIDHSILDAHG